MKNTKEIPRITLIELKVHYNLNISLIIDRNLKDGMQRFGNFLNDSYNILKYFLISFNSSSSSASSERKEDKTASWFGMYGISSLSSSAILTHQFEEKIDHTKCVNMLHVCLHFFLKIVLNFIFSRFCLKGVNVLILYAFYILSLHAISS